MGTEFKIDIEKLEKIKAVLPNIIYEQLLKYATGGEKEEPVAVVPEKTEVSEMVSEEEKILSGGDSPIVEQVTETTTAAPTKDDYLSAIEAMRTMIDVTEGEEKQGYIDAIEAMELMLESFN